MRHLVLLALLLSAPALCLASPGAVAVPAAQVSAACKAKADEAPVAQAAAPTDAPVRNAEAAPARPAAVAAPGSVRTATPRWNRLLPGMFR